MDKELAEAKRIIEGLVGLLGNCSVESGVCCCGDDMARHASPMCCGHSPVDSGAYYADGLLKDATKWLEVRATSATQPADGAAAER